MLRVPSLVWIACGLGGATILQSLEHRALLCACAEWVEIEGGNHVRSGHYRHQFMNQPAAMPSEAQQRAAQRPLVRTVERLSR